jgi:predicted phosphate transport protein (TIGR00153 family)
MLGVRRRDRLFFDLLEAHARTGRDAARILLESLENPTGLAAQVEKIKTLEHEGDEITHKLFAESSRIFITPLEREDIHGLASSLDDVLDHIDGAAARLLLFRIGGPVPGLKPLAEVLVKQTEILGDIMPRLMENSRVLESCIKIHSLENEGDRIQHQALVEIFADPRDAILLIKQKELIETLEAATDRCEDVANVLETIVLKNA